MATSAMSKRKTSTRSLPAHRTAFIPKLQKVIDVVNPAWLVLWAREGPMSHAAAMRSIELLGKEVIPAIKAYQPRSDDPQGAREHNS